MTLQLYPYQQAGVDWLTARDGNACLWDDQGLGKTAQVIRAAEQVGAGRVLVLCPTCVLWNWEREIRKWQMVNLPAVVVDKSADAHAIGRATWTVTTHGLLIRPQVRAAVLRQQWDVVIVDEAHFFRTPTAKRSQALFLGPDALVRRARRTWLLTGTPMPNHVGELWTALAGCFPERIMRAQGDRPVSHSTFVGRYCKTAPCIYQGRKIVGNQPEALPDLKQRLDGVALRRLKKHVLKDLPPIRHETVFLRPDKLPPTFDAAAQHVAAVCDDTDDPDAILAALESMKTDKAFSEWRRACGLAKIAPCVDLLDMELADGGLGAVVVFAHHTDVVASIAAGLARYGSATITGATSPAQRQQHVEDFQAGKLRVIVCNILAGGTGTTLTAAADVVFAELSFVPGENAQAADRIYRIGQEADSVLVRFLSLAGTVDEAVVSALRRKTQMIREVLDE